MCSVKDESLVAGRSGMDGSCAWLDGARHGRAAADFRFGKRVHNIVGRLPQAIEKLDHVDGPGGYAAMEQTLGGLETTRFRKGFQRRQKDVIASDAKRLAYESMKRERQEAQALRKREVMQERADYNGFDVVAGTFDPSKIRNERKQARNLSDRPSAELIKSGDIKVRNSHYRFYVDPPPEKIKARQVRQQLIVHEGLTNSKKMSSLLGIGRSDLLSYGVEDQFSRSQYQPDNCRVPGLVEHRSANFLTPSEHQSTKSRIFGATWRQEEETSSS